MIQLLEYVFWISVALIVYPYVVFPLLVWLRGFLYPRPVNSRDIEPAVSLVIAAHNEADSIAEKLENSLSLDYPPGRLEIIVASDGSTDGTDSIVQSYCQNGARVRLLSLPRRGKAYALNAAVAASCGDVLVFSDATSIYAPDALRRLVRPLADASVGGVAGNLVYRRKKEKSLAEDGEQFHSGLDRILKRAASRTSHALSASGVMYAIRRTLFQPVPEGVTDDFVISTRVVAQGFRLVFAADACAYDPATKSNISEFGRKTRVMTRGFRSLIEMRVLFNPLRYGFYSWQLFSHKVLRRLVVLPLILLLLVNPLLWNEGIVYRASICVQIAVYGLAALGLASRGTVLGRSKLVSIPFYFCLVNAAALLAAANLLRGRQIVQWEPERPDEPWLQKNASVAGAETISST